VVAMTRTSGVLRIALDNRIIGRGHAKIAERGHVPWLSLIVGMFASTLCLIQGRKIEKVVGSSQRKSSHAFCSSCPVRVVLFSHHC
jgi:hypothetical protein